MFVTSAGRGDDAPFRRDGTDVERGVAALVAMGDGGDAEHVHWACRSSGRGVLPHDVGGRTRRRTIAIVIAMVMVIRTGGSAGVDAQAGAAAGDGGVMLERRWTIADGAADTRCWGR